MFCLSLKRPLLRLFVFLLLCVSPSIAFSYNSLVTGGVCKTSRKGCRSTVGNAGGAGACCDPVSAKILHCISSNACVGGQPYRWSAANQPLGWTFFDNGRPDNFAKHTTEAFEKALKQAWDGWTVPACTSFRHKYLGRGSQNGSRVDIQLPSSQVWNLMGVSGALAFATPRATRSGSITTSSVFFGPGYNWGVNSVGLNEMDFKEVAHHEIGHAIGFAHTPYRTAVMYYQAQSPGPNFGGPGVDDVKAVCNVYPMTTEKTCTKDSDCGGCWTCLNGKCNLKDGGILCPCTQNSQCASGLVCKNTRCQKAQGSDALDFCDDKVPCKAGLTCMRTRQGQVCMQTCGKGAAYPPGSPGSACNIDGSCPSGNECALLIDERTVCLRSCTQDANCTGGGKCTSINLSGQTEKFCLCGEGNTCGVGYSCNKEYIGGIAGICAATKTAPETCPSGFTCSEVLNGHTACVPDPGNRRAGETCGPFFSCSAGLVCALIDPSRNKRVCVEDCGTSGQCRLRGICRPVGKKLKHCFCYQDSDCGDQRTCEHNESGKGVCTGKPNVCGNGECEAGNGENCVTCDKDCACGAGSVCNESKSTCEKAKVCGNGQCEPDNKENCGSCPEDCKCQSPLVCESSACREEKGCGDGTCDASRGEDCKTCEQDCACETGKVCEFGLCTSACGDGKCDSTKGEDCSTCSKDCSCKDNETCESGTCKVPPAEPAQPDAGAAQDEATLNCPASQQKEQCDADGKSCKKVCAGGCGCQATTADATPFAFLFSLMLLMWVGRLRRRHSA